eukprot:6204463-Pleurochrysis_carterae.AAC.1
MSSVLVGAWRSAHNTTCQRALRSREHARHGCGELSGRADGAVQEHVLEGAAELVSALHRLALRDARVHLLRARAAAHAHLHRRPVLRHDLVRLVLLPIRTVVTAAKRRHVLVAERASIVRDFSVGPGRR